jgi:hypothetical protein
LLEHVPRFVASAMSQVGVDEEHTDHGRRSRGEDHREAAALLRQIVPGGDRAAMALVELLNLKDTAQYGLIPITRRELTVVLRRANGLLKFAGDVLRR